MLRKGGISSRRKIVIPYSCLLVNSEGKIIIMDVFKENLDGIMFYLINRVSEVENDLERWRNFLIREDPDSL